MLQPSKKKEKNNRDYSEDGEPGIKTPESASTPEPVVNRSYRILAGITRWLGRIWGTLLVIFFVIAFPFFGLMNPSMPGFVWIVAGLFTTGFITAWRKEGLGASISLAGLAGFYIAYWFYDRDELRYWTWVFIPILPPVIFYLVSYLLRRSKKE